MESSANLFQLIKSMTPHEKRYFKIYASRHEGAGGNSYIRLFDAIDGQQQYDEKKLKQKFKSAIRHFAFAKNYLYHSVLTGLHIYHIDSSYEADILTQLHEVKILYEKGLYELCFKLLETIRETAEGLDKYNYVLEALMWKERVVRNFFHNGNEENELSAISEEIKKTILRIGNVYDFQRLSSEAMNLSRKSGKIVSGKEKIAYDIIRQSAVMKTERLTAKSSYLFHEINGLYYFAVNDNRRYEEELLKQISIIETRPFQIKEDPFIYLRVLYNLQTCYALSGRSKEFFQLLKKIEDAPKQYHLRVTPLMELRSFVYLSLQTANLYIHLPDYSHAEKIAGKVEEGMKRFGGEIRELEKAALFGNISILFFGAENYRKALEWLNKILNSPKLREIRLDVIIYIRLFNLVIHYELGNLELLQAQVNSTYALLKNRDRLTRKEQIIIHLFKALLKENFSGAKRSREAFMKANKQLAALSDREPTLGFEFMHWTESRIRGCSFEEVAREYAKRSR